MWRVMLGLPPSGVVRRRRNFPMSLFKYTIVRTRARQEETSPRVHAMCALYYAVHMEYI